MNDTTPLLIVQMAADDESMENDTVNPDDAVAEGLYVEPPTVAREGLEEVNVNDWAPGPTLMLCETRAAAI